MNVKKTAVVFLMLVLAAGAAFLAAEVALDEVVQAGRFVFYRDHADPHKYYYVPDAPRLATRRDGTPEFTFIKYSKTDGATKGGVCHFLVTWGYTSGELSSAESALRMTDPEAKVAGPVPFKEGTFRIVSATAGEGGLFTRRIAGEGKAPIMPGQKAAVSIALTEEGATLLWESFRNPTSDVSVQFMLKFAGITPAFQAKLKVDWDKVYTQHDIKLHAEGQIKVVKLEVDVRAIMEELRQKGSIELEVVGENENMQKMLDTAYAHILAMMAEKVPVGTGEAAAPPAKKRPAPLAVGVGSFALPAPDAGGTSAFVRAWDESRRGGPFWPQDQAQSERPAGQDDCAPAARNQAKLLESRAKSFGASQQFREAVDAYEKAYSACPDPQYLYWLGSIWHQNLRSLATARDKYQAFLDKTEATGRYPEFRNTTRERLNLFDQAQNHLTNGLSIHQDADQLDRDGQKNQAVTRYLEAVAAYRQGQALVDSPSFLNNIAGCYFCIGDMMNDRGYLEKSREMFKSLWEFVTQFPESRKDINQSLEYINEKILEINKKLQSMPAGRPETQTQRPAGEQTDARPPDKTDAVEAKPPAAKPGAKAAAAEAPPDKPAPKAKPETGAPQAKAAPGQKPAPGMPSIESPIKVQIGYSFKRIKLSGKYEVDMRKRLREDREVVMSGNISGVFQKYGDDRRFFSVVSLDDPTFQERSIEVILDGQDFEDFKNYINSVSVLFRKQRFSGAPMTGEVKFFDEQFADKGNRMSFKYGRLNEAATEWLDYEYKPKWSFYGGVEWEGEWTRTSDSVLTMSPPARRRTIEISVDEDNILASGIKAVAFQVKHRIYGKDVLKEVVIRYDRGDPLQTSYTYFHEEGRLGYSYKAIWLFMDGREVHSEWISRESPFVYAQFTR